MDRYLINAPKARTISQWWMFCSTFSLVCLGGLSAYGASVDRALILSQAPTLERPSSAASEATGRAILRSGSRGVDVTELQAALKLLGFYNGAVDGFFGETTITAVGRFQEAAGLGKDGIVGPVTWERLFPPDPIALAPTPTATPRAPASRPTETDSKPAPAATSTSATFPILRKGMSGDAVRGLQERLRSIGLLEGAVDGAFGEITETAVKAAQRKYQLDPDGVVGPGTWRAILR